MARLGSWIRTGWVLYVSTCVKLDVTCVVCSVRRMHSAGYGREGHMCSRGEPLGSRGLFFFNARVTSWLPARVVRNPAGWSNSLPDGSVHGGRGTLQLHDVTGKVQHVRLIIAAQVRELRVAVLDAHVNLKRINLERKKQTSLSGGHGFPGQG